MEWGIPISYQMEMFLRSKLGRKFLATDPDTPAVSVSPLLSLRNRDLFFGKEGARTIGQVKELIEVARPDLIY